MKTQTITVKVDKTTNRVLRDIAKRSDKTKSDLVRQAVGKYIKNLIPSGGESLLQMAKDSKRYKYNAPKDIIENIDKYLYE